MLIRCRDTTIPKNIVLAVVSLTIGITKKSKYIVAATTTFKSKNYPDSPRNVINVTTGIMLPKSVYRHITIPNKTFFRLK